MDDETRAFSRASSFDGHDHGVEVDIDENEKGKLAEEGEHSSSDEKVSILPPAKIHKTGSDYGYQVIQDFKDKTEFIEGNFFDQIVNGRGYLKIRKADEFQMRSMYRKRDKQTRDGNVSLLVGKTEVAPYDEKVISILFDLDDFTEERAFEWWETNKRRFSDNQSNLRRQSHQLNTNQLVNST